MGCDQFDLERRRRRAATLVWVNGSRRAARSSQLFGSPAAAGSYVPSGSYSVQLRLQGE